MIPTIVLLPGDGIGGIVLEESIRVLNAAGFEANYVKGDIGWEYWKKEGNALPQRTIDLLSEHKIALFGAITSKPKDDAVAELNPELANKGFVYASPIVGMRQFFNLDICIRPCKSYPSNPLNFVRRGREVSSKNLRSMLLSFGRTQNACIAELNGQIHRMKFIKHL